MADPGIVAKLAGEAAKPENRRYSDNEIVYGVKGLNPETDQKAHSTFMSEPRRESRAAGGLKTPRTFPST